jgi:phage gp29-like protein
MAKDTALVPKPEKGLQAEATRLSGRSIRSKVDVDTLTPDLMHALLIRAETGDPAAQADLFSRMEERDPMLDGHLRTRKMGVLRAEAEVVPAGESAQAMKAAEFCEGILEGIEDWDQARFDLLDAIGKYFSVCEIEWDTQSVRREWRIRRLIYRPQAWFTFAADGMTLLLKDEQGIGQDMPPTNFIVNRIAARSGFSARTALLRSLVRPFAIRHFGWKDWAAFSDKFGMPLAVGHLPTNVGFDSDDAGTLWNMLLNIGSDMAVMMPEGWLMEFVGREGTGTGEVFEKLILMAETELTLAVLGQTLTSRGEKGGSYALGQVHNEVRFDLLESDAKALGTCITQQLFKPLVWFNLGPTFPVPSYQVVVEQPEDLVALSTVVTELADAGLAIPASWVYEKFGIPEPEEGEAVLAGSAAGAEQGGASSGDGTTPGQTEPGVAREAEDVEEGSESAAAASNRAMMLTGANMPEWSRMDGFTSWAGFNRVHLDRFVPMLCQTILLDPVDDLYALEFLTEKKIATAQTWAALSDGGKARAWWVSGLGIERTREVVQHLLEVAGSRGTLSNFLERLEADGLSVPGAAIPGRGQIANWHARLVYHNNLRGAQSAAQWVRLQETIADRPYGEWTVGAQVCPICAPLDGHIAPLDGVFFAEFWPPLHHDCQCDVLSVSQRDVDREGLAVGGRDPEPGEEGADWTGNPADSYYLEGRGMGPVSAQGIEDKALLDSMPGLRAPKALTEKL